MNQLLNVLLHEYEVASWSFAVNQVNLMYPQYRFEGEIIIKKKEKKNNRKIRNRIRRKGVKHQRH